MTERQDTSEAQQTQATRELLRTNIQSALDQEGAPVLETLEKLPDTVVELLAPPDLSLVKPNFERDPEKACTDEAVDFLERIRNGEVIVSQTRDGGHFLSRMLEPLSGSSRGNGDPFAGLVEHNALADPQQYEVLYGYPGMVIRHGIRVKPAKEVPPDRI